MIAYHDYLRSDAWKVVARTVKERAGFRCQVCNSPDDLVAHHRSYAHLGDEMSHLGDLTCLCRPCHERYHDPKEVNGRMVCMRMPVKAPLSPMPTPPRSTKAQRRSEARRLKRERRLLARQNRLGNAPLVVADGPKIKQFVSGLYDHEADMPVAFPFRVTKAFMRTLKTAAGGYSAATIEALGCSFPPKTKWARSCVGMMLSEEQCRRALVGRETTSTYFAMKRSGRLPRQFHSTAPL